MGLITAIAPAYCAISGQEFLVWEGGIVYPQSPERWPSVCGVSLGKPVQRRRSAENMHAESGALSHGPFPSPLFYCRPTEAWRGVPPPHTHTHTHIHTN